MMKTKNYLIKLLVLEINMVHDSYDTAYFDKDLLLFESERLSKSTEVNKKGIG